MAFESLSQRAAIWRNLGLKYILAGTETRKPEVFSAQPQRSFAKASGRPQTVSARHGRKENAEIAPGPETVNASRSPQPLPEIAPPRAWPDEWRELLESGRIQPGKVAWTYFNLGLDLLAGDAANNPDFKNQRDKRRALLGQLLAYMAKPSGTHTFWPVSLPCDNGQLNIPCFWGGLLELKCRVVVIMGARIASKLLNGPCGPLEMRPAPVKGCSALALMDIEALFNKPDYRASINFLQKAFPRYFDPSR